MSDRVSFIVSPVSGTQVLLMDFSGFLTAIEALPHIEAARELVAQQPPLSVYGLVDVTGSKFNTQVVESLKDLANQNRPYIRASAVAGVAGLQKIIMDGVLSFTGRTNLKGFAERGEALRWLATQ